MLTLCEKILQDHQVEGSLERGSEIAIKIDQTLTQDATGTLAYLQLEAMGIDQVKTEISLSYIDHNTLQSGFENADDHKYLQTVALKHGVHFSRPGNGICHQVHLERFARPGKTLLGSDSHTPTAGGIASLAMGAGGLDVACAMAGLPFHLTMPNIVNIHLLGTLQHGVTSKDIILKVLQLLGVKGGVGKVLEYSGEGITSLSVPQRATITNMGAELGATSSLFPSDDITKNFLNKQGRCNEYVPLFADEDAIYDETYTIDLTALEPMIAMPHSPDNVMTVKELEGLRVDQCCIGSCTNSSYIDMMNVSQILKDQMIDEHVSLTISPGSRQVLTMLSKNGALSTMIASGARILESTCGPCIGMGQSPISNALSLRTFNRNFYGRSGTLSAKVCLVSPETAAYSAIKGYLADPREATFQDIEEPETFDYNDDFIIFSNGENARQTEVIRGPNIKELPKLLPLTNIIDKQAILKVGDNITTDHIMPAGAKVLPYRSNIEKISEFVFENVKPNFANLCKQYNSGFIIAGHNYGQGSSREHAALAPRYLGIQVVLAKSFARIHHANLINFGILPIIFKNEQDYDDIDELDELIIEHLDTLAPNAVITIQNRTKNHTYLGNCKFNERDIATLQAGGTLNYIRQLQNS